MVDVHRMRDEADDPAEAAAAPAARRRIPWAAIGGFVSLFYVVWRIADLALLDASPDGFNTARRALGTIGLRAVIALVFLAILFHGLNGLRVFVADLLPRSARLELWWRALVSCLTLAIWMPCALVVLWPAVRDWFVR